MLVSVASCRLQLSRADYRVRCFNNMVPSESHAVGTLGTFLRAHINSTFLSRQVYADLKLHGLPVLSVQPAWITFRTTGACHFSQHSEYLAHRSVAGSWVRLSSSWSRPSLFWVFVVGSHNTTSSTQTSTPEMPSICSLVIRHALRRTRTIL